MKTLLTFAMVLLLTTSAAAQTHLKVPLASVDDSGIGGFVQLQALPQGGTRIVVVANGLEAGHDYVSLYYDNDVCELEPYSAEDVIGEYTGHRGGRAATAGVADDDLDEIHSVSVRDADSFALLACASFPES